MKEKKLKSSLPPILFGATWVVYALVGIPLYKPWHLIFPIALSLIVLSIAKKKSPGRTITVAEPVKLTGQAEVDELLKRGQAYMTEIAEANAAIKDKAVSAKCDELIKHVAAILASVRKNPRQEPQVRRFMDYYLPTAAKLLDSFRTIETAPERGKNMRETVDRIDAGLSLIVQAAGKQQDVLFQDEMLDISTDVDVLETLLEKDGLA